MTHELEAVGIDAHPRTGQPETPADPSGPGPENTRPRRWFTRRRWWLAGVLGLCLVIVLAVVLPRIDLPGPFRPEPEPRALPEQVVGGYWMKWRESNSIRLAQVDPRYNVIYLAFAQGREGTGALHFKQTAQSPEQFAADIDTVRARGQRIILSIGGEGGYVDMSTQQRRQEMVDSIIAMHRQEVFFDGIDWDIEGIPLDIEGAVWVSAQLKEHFGENFAITLAPPGHLDEYRVFAQQLGDNLSYIGLQYYDYPTADQTARIDGVEYETRDLVEQYGIPPEKIVLGMAVVDYNTRQYAPDGASNFWTVESSVQGWQRVEAAFPGLRGVYLWEVSGDARLGSSWVSTMAPQVVVPPEETTSAQAG